MEGRRLSFSLGAGLALLSAILFGASTPLAKVLLSSVEPWLLAAVLYLGSGVGLFVARLAWRVCRPPEDREVPVAGTGWLWLGSAILFGGVIAPVLLMAGLTYTPAASASLLLNLEGVLTAVLAWFAFREHFDRRIALGMLAITLGAGLLSWQGGFSLRGVAGPIAIAAACLGWALDNNLTRKVSLNDPVQIAMVKGLAAGSINLSLALWQGVHVPDYATLAVAGLVGAVGYGLSLVLFILALRHIGTARTGAYYSTAPFVGAAIAVLLFGEPFTIILTIAAALMAFGVWLHLTERHDHSHTHEAIEHEHRHVHNEHHSHSHSLLDSVDEPHAHWHEHDSIVHRHPHYPDSHHRHDHAD
jgi:drug/metabolite transporter (DMT)-like permease